MGDAWSRNEGGWVTKTETISSGHTIPVLEIFGPTIQGEGAVIGQKTMFVRTAGCDYRCSWCDSSFTWDGTEKPTKMTAEDILEQLLVLGSKDGEDNFDCVTISGGNPALLGEGMAELINLLHQEGISVALETQGSKWQNWFYGIDYLTLSPKPPSSGMLKYPAMDNLDKIIERLGNKIEGVSLKIVIFNDEDYAFAQSIHAKYPHIPFYLQVGNEDVDSEGNIAGQLLEKLSWLVDKVIQDPLMNDTRVLPQLHTLIWANLRGV